MKDAVAHATKAILRENGGLVRMKVFEDAAKAARAASQLARATPTPPNAAAFEQAVQRLLSAALAMNASTADVAVDGTPEVTATVEGQVKIRLANVVQLSLDPAAARDLAERIIAAATR